MSKQTTVRKYGGSLGVTLPKAMMDRLNLAAGDKVYVRETEGGIILSPYNPDFERAMEAAERVTKRYQNALRELAK
ncbi:MAG: AbrB/MazE/SpoVT family DNA-binding domain-containing protein [Caldilineaceae bacterium]